MVHIIRRVEFCASHRLHNPNFPDAKNDAIYGKCNNPNGHGHNYVLEVTVGGRVDPQTGMVMDLKQLKALLEEVVVEKVDHKHLNLDVDFMEGVIPTAENIVVGLWGLVQPRLPRGCKLVEMKLWESENNIAVYHGDGAKLARHTKPAAKMQPRRARNAPERRRPPG